MGLLKKLGLKKKSKKEKKDVDIPKGNSHPISPPAVNEAEVPAAPETDDPDSPEPENDFARALIQKSARLRHIEPPKPPPPIVPETPPAAIGVDDDDDDEGEIAIGETDSEEEEENNEFLRAIRNTSLKKQSSAEKEITKPQAQAVLADKEETRKSSADERVAQMFAKQREEDLTKAKNRETERIAEIKLNNNQADERVAQMFNKQNESDTNRIEKNFGYKPPQKKGTSDERVAQMFSKHKSGVEEKGEPKGSTKVEIPHETTSSTNSPGIEKTVGLSFAERRKMAEAMSQRKLVVTEQKHTVDIKKENFGNRTSFAERRKMLEAKSQQQNAPSPVRAPKINIRKPANEAQSIPQQNNLSESNTVEEGNGDPSNVKSVVGQSADDEDFVDLCELQDDSQEIDESEISENPENTGGSESSQKEVTNRKSSRLLMAVAQAAAAKKEAAS